ncbi:MAG: hypothetical protein ACUVRA_09305, partial [Candidatus Bathyarchaeaceae archaeon]
MFCLIFLLTTSTFPFLSITFPVTSEDLEIYPIPRTYPVELPGNISEQATTSEEVTSQPAMLGYMYTENSLRYAVSKTRVTVSFPDT